MSNPILTIPDEAKDIITGDDLYPNQVRRLRQIEGEKIIAKAVNDHVRHKMFGPSMKPTLKQQLFMWSSFAAIKTAWASQAFVEKLRARTRN